MAYQSLYRRYRSGRFDELVGQHHVVTALKNAIREGRVGHAYLFSGPRGTGKTSTARILGKALNCTNLGDDGEPCCECDSCLSFASGTSYDLQELDAASNNGVEAIRDLISKVALGSPGRTKVYILDEVHMLTAGAENALLKTLEEPPDHVVFVLATTEPHKVVPTIRSRTQHYEFELIPAEELGAHVRYVADDAGLDVSDEMIDYVLRAGGGSARDTLSALEQVVAAGGIPRDEDAIHSILRGLAENDAGRVVASVSEAIKAGRDPRVIGESLLARLRDAFLAAMGAPTDHLSEAQAAAAAELAGAMGPAAITRSLEVVGISLIEMRQAPDPRVDLEVALLRLSKPELDTDLKAIVARIERLEAGGVPSAPPAAAASASDTAAPELAESAAAPQAPAAAGRPADGARAALHQVAAPSSAGAPTELPPAAPDAPSTAAEAEPSPPAAAPGGQTLGARRRSAKEPAPAPEQPAPAETPTEVAAPDPAVAESDQAPAAPEPAPAAASAPVASGGAPSLSAIEAAWPEVKAQLPGRAKSRFSGGRFLESGPNGVVFGLPNAIHRDRCADCATDVEAAMAARFGAPIKLHLVVDGNAQPPTRAAEPASPPSSSNQPATAEPQSDEVVDLDALTDAPADAADGIDLLTDAFPGAEVIEPEPG